MREDWDRLNEDLFHGNPYFDSRFISALVRVFADGSERLFVHRREVIDGLLILRPARGKWTSFAPSQAQVVPVLVRNPQDLLSLRRGWALEFLNQDTDAPLPQGTFSFDHALTINVAVEGGFDAYWARFPSKARGEMNRRRRKAGEVVLAVHERPDSMAEFVARFGAMEQAGWKGREGTAVAGDQLDFYSEVMTEFARGGDATGYELIVEGRTVAMQMALHSSRMLVLLKTTFDENARNLSPGRIMQYEILQREFALGRVDTIEFFTNAGATELAWATDSRRIRHHLLPRNALVRAAYRCVRGLSARPENNEPPAERPSA